MEALNLTKGQTLDLKKADGSALSDLRIGLSWDAPKQVNPTDPKFDLDVFVVKNDAEKTILFYGNRDANPIAGMELSPDNQDGAGEGDDEWVKMNATKTSDGTYNVFVDIHEATTRGQSMSQVTNAVATVYNNETNEVLAKFNMTEAGGSNTAILVARVTDAGDSYKFEAVGNYMNGDINALRASV